MEQSSTPKRKASSEAEGSEPKKRRKIHCSGEECNYQPFSTGVKDIFEALENIVRNTSKAVQHHLESGSHENFQQCLSTVPTWNSVVYDTVFGMCIQREPFNHSSQAYEEIPSLLHRLLEPYLDHDHEFEGENWLPAFCHVYGVSFNLVKAVVLCFSYLDRFYTPNNLLPGVEATALLCVKEKSAVVFCCDTLKYRIEHLSTVNELHRMWEIVQMDKNRAFIKNSQDLEVVVLKTTLRQLSLKITLDLILTVVDFTLGTHSGVDSEPQEEEEEATPVPPPPTASQILSLTHHNPYAGVVTTPEGPGSIY